MSPQNDVALEVGNLPVDSLWGCGFLGVPNLPVDSLWGCGFLGVPITPPALSFFPALLFCPMWHHAGKQQHFIWHQFAHIYSWAPVPTLPQRMTECSAHPGTTVLNIFLTTSKQEEGRTLLFFSDKFWCWKLTSNSSSMSNTLPLSRDFHYLLPPSPTDLCFLSSFPPCTLCLAHRSFPLSSYFSAVFWL